MGILAHVQVTTDEINVVSHHVGLEATRKGCRSVTFLGNFVVGVDRAKRDCGGVCNRRMPQDGQVDTVGTGVELARDVRCVVARFLQDNCVEAATDCSEDLCGPLASWALRPLEHGKAILVVHKKAARTVETDVRVDLGNTKAGHGEHSGQRFVHQFRPRVGCGMGVSGSSRVGGTSWEQQWSGKWDSRKGETQASMCSRLVDTNKHVRGRRDSQRATTSHCVIWRRCSRRVGTSRNGFPTGRYSPDGHPGPG